MAGGLGGVTGGLGCVSEGMWGVAGRLGGVARWERGRGLQEEATSRRIMQEGRLMISSGSWAA